MAIFGSGFTSRLMSTVRDKEGLTYHIGASVADDTFNDGDWRINATFAPSLLDKGLASTQRELLRWSQDGVTAAELEARKNDLVGSFQVGLATTDGILSLRGRWFEWRSADGALELPALPTLHPAFLLRQPAAKKHAWEDLLKLTERLDRPARPT